MSWHRLPSNDAWKSVTLASVHGLGQRVWLRCNQCGHENLADAIGFAADHHLEPGTPLLTIARRLKCTRCGARKAHCWPEPYAIGSRS